MNRKYYSYDFKDFNRTRDQLERAEKRRQRLDRAMILAILAVLAVLFYALDQRAAQACGADSRCTACEVRTSAGI